LCCSLSVRLGGLLAASSCLVAVEICRANSSWSCASLQNTHQGLQAAQSTAKRHVTRLALAA
jgi:hypothetical protein